jgi:hypothetical protein
MLQGLLVVWVFGVVIHLAFFTHRFSMQSARGEHDHLDARGSVYLWSIAGLISVGWPLFMIAYVPVYFREKTR